RKFLGPRLEEDHRRWQGGANVVPHLAIPAAPENLVPAQGDAVLEFQVVSVCVTLECKAVLALAAVEIGLHLQVRARLETLVPARKQVGATGANGTVEHAVVASSLVQIALEGEAAGIGAPVGP